LRCADTCGQRTGDSAGRRHRRLLCRKMDWTKSLRSANKPNNTAEPTAGCLAEHPSAFAGPSLGCALAARLTTPTLGSLRIASEAQRAPGCHCTHVSPMNSRGSTVCLRSGPQLRTCRLPALATTRSTACTRHPSQSRRRACTAAHVGSCVGRVVRSCRPVRRAAGVSSAR
jgi:hypothetical protein